MPFNTLVMSDHDLLLFFSYICPTNSWPLGVQMLSVLKLVPGDTNELNLRPPKPEKLQMF